MTAHFTTTKLRRIQTPAPMPDCRHTFSTNRKLLLYIWNMMICKILAARLGLEDYKLYPPIWGSVRGREGSHRCEGNVVGLKNDRQVMTYFKVFAPIERLPSLVGGQLFSSQAAYFPMYRKDKAQVPALVCQILEGRTVGYQYTLFMNDNQPRWQYLFKAYSMCCGCRELFKILSTRNFKYSNSKQQLPPGLYLVVK